MDLAIKDGSVLKKRRSLLFKRIMKNKMVYLLTLPSIICFIIYAYVPMLGITLAFKDFQLGKGFMGIFTSPSVGFDNFKRLFTSFYFYDVLKNTLLISFYKILFGFPAPILLALLLNELKGKFFKRFVQTVTYLPNFLSAVVVTGLAYAMLSPTFGLINAVIGTLGMEPIHFLANSNYFRSIIVGIDVWKGTGFGAIIYLAAIASVDPQLYESAKMDGANKFRQIWHITLPQISDIIILLFILRIGDVLNAGFEQVFLLYSSPVYNVGDIIDTFVYREGLVNSSYGYSTAVGLFKSVAGLILIVAVNSIAKRFGKQGIW